MMVKNQMRILHACHVIQRCWRNYKSRCVLEIKRKAWHEMIQNEKKLQNFGTELTDMHDACEDLYDRYIMQPRIPFLIKVQRAWRNIRTRRLF